MAAPITWRNVNAPSNAAANALLSSGTSDIRDSLRSAQDLSRGVDQNNLANAANQRKVDTETVLGRIGQLGSMEEYDAAVAAGTFAPDAFADRNVDRTAIREALSSQDNTIRTEATDTFNYDNTLRRQSEEPIEAQINSMIASGDVAGAKALMAQGGVRDTSQFSNAITTRQNDIQDRGNRNALLGLQMQNQKLGIEQKQGVLTDLAKTRVDKAEALTYNTLLQTGIDGIIDSGVSNSQGREDLRIQLSELPNMTPAKVTSAMATLDKSFAYKQSLTPREQEYSASLTKINDTGLQTSLGAIQAEQTERYGALPVTTFKTGDEQLDTMDKVYGQMASVDEDWFTTDEGGDDLVAAAKKSRKDVASRLGIKVADITPRIMASAWAATENTGGGVDETILEANIEEAMRSDMQDRKNKAARKVVDKELATRTKTANDAYTKQAKLNRQATKVDSNVRAYFQGI